MNLALVIERLDPQRGGAERSVYEMALSLARRGIQVTILAGEFRGEALDRANFSCQPIEVGRGSRVSRWRNFIRNCEDHIHQEDYDVIHSVVPLRVADIYQPRGGSIRYNQQRHASSFQNWAVRWCKHRTAGWNRSRQARLAQEESLCRDLGKTRLAAVSRYVSNQYCALYGLDDAQIPVIRNGIDTGPFRREGLEQRGRQLRDSLGVDDQVLFLFVAENLRLKGLDWLIDSVSLLMQRGIIKSHPFEVAVISGQDAGRYETRIHRCGLGGRFRFQGTIVRDQMAEWYAAADVIVLPTWHDACSRVVLEGLAAGKPAITTQYNGACDFLDNGRHGIILEQCGDIETLAQALATMVQPEHRLEYLQAIRDADLGPQLSMDRHVDELISLYQGREQAI